MDDRPLSSLDLDLLLEDLESFGLLDRRLFSSLGLLECLVFSFGLLDLLLDLLLDCLLLLSSSFLDLP